MGKERRRAGAAHVHLRAGARGRGRLRRRWRSLLLPIGGHAPDWGLGNDALVLVGLLALARFAVTLAAWDTAGAFGLMGAARDLMFSVFVEGLLLLVLVLLALPLHSTDLLSMSHAATLS